MKENKRPATRAETEAFFAMKEKINKASEKERNIIYEQLEAKKVALMRKGIKAGKGSRW
jgi:hypothetical protein